MQGKLPKLLDLLRAKIVALQEQLAIEQARKDAEVEKQREEKARSKQELHGEERP